MKTQILFAAPESEQLDAHCTFLDGCGYDVHTTDNALACFDRLIERPPTALILQRGLLWGGVDGILARMRGVEHPLNVPVVILGGRESVESLEKLLGEPVIACLRDPVRPVELLKCLVFAESRHSARAAAERTNSAAAKPNGHEPQPQSNAI